jgi:glycosyltransferase involved in cell wall biosynthesis
LLACTDGSPWPPLFGQKECLPERGGHGEPPVQFCLEMTDKPSISVFFPAYNDAGTIASLVMLADRTLRGLSDDYEVIVVNDGSADHTAQVLSELEAVYPRLRVVNHPVNRGYGSALRTGFASASKDLIFYTDGDAQYDVRELEKLVTLMTDDVDIVNGYKISRSDPLHRIVIGSIYCWAIKLAFGIKIKDVDCDFRLVRRAGFNRVRLSSTSGTICVEMIKSLQDAGLRFAESPVHHYHRAYGKSQFFNFRRLFKTLTDLSRLWWRLVIKRQVQLVHPADQIGDEARTASDSARVDAVVTQIKEPTD